MKFRNPLLALAIIALFTQCQTSTTQSNSNNSNPTTTTLVRTDSVAQQSTTKAEITESALVSPNQQAKNGEASPSVKAHLQESNEAFGDVQTDAALLYKGLSPQSQVFDLKGNEINRLECKGGTIILVNRKSFEYEDGTPLSQKTSVTLKVTEYLKRSEMLLSPLTTTTHDGKTLETGGMVYAYAFANSKKCRLKRDSAMHIGFKMTDDDRFQLFDGSEAANNLVEWSLAPDSQPVNAITHNKVDKRPQFSYGKLEDYIIRNIGRTVAMKKYNAEGFTICALVTIDKQGKVIQQRLAENKDVFRDVGIDTAFLGMVQRMPLWIPAFKKGKPVRSRAMIAFNFSGFRDESAQIKMISSEEYASSMRLTVDGMLANIDDDILTFPVKRLGWINCDRFYNDPRPKAQLLVDANGQNADIKLIFKKINAIMSVSRIQTKQYKSPEIPIGESVYVVGVRKEGTQFFYGMQEATVDNKTIALNFMPVSDAELKEKLKELNN